MNLMTSGPAEQRNRYKGFPARPWVRLRLTALDGVHHELEILADTANPCALIISRPAMLMLKWGDAPDIKSNFGLLEGGWLHIHMPQLGLDLDLRGYASDAVVSGAQASSPDFQGLVGLPLLRMLEYGGDLNWFWLRPAVGRP
jgi:hypothetical protein